MILPMRRLMHTRVPDGHCLHRIFARGCDATAELSVYVHGPLSEDRDYIGVPMDAVWRIAGSNAPDRYLRIKGGIHTLQKLLSTYLIMDGTFCPFTFNMQNSIERLASDVQYTHERGHHRRDQMWSCELLPVCAHSRTSHPRESLIMGIPQRTLKSGLCWYGSMWYAVLTPRALRRTFRKFAHASDPAVARALDEILQSPATAEHVRRHLYATYSIGDDPDQDPRLDGQNGYKQLTSVFDALGVPHRTYVLHKGGAVVPVKEEGAVDVRFGDDGSADVAIAGLRCPYNHRVPPFSFDADGYTFELQSGLVGNQECGHQTALSRCSDGSWWSAYDADLVTMDVGPISFRMTDKDPLLMWAAYEKSTLVSKRTASTKFCDMNAVNRTQEALVQMMDGAEPSTRLARVHADWLYVGRRSRHGQSARWGAL